MCHILAFIAFSIMLPIFHWLVFPIVRDIQNALTFYRVKLLTRFFLFGQVFSSLYE